MDAYVHLSDFFCQINGKTMLLKMLELLFVARTLKRGTEADRAGSKKNVVSY